jgi:hypothetical protein
MIPADFREVATNGPCRTRTYDVRGVPPVEIEVDDGEVPVR